MSALVSISAEHSAPDQDERFAVHRITSLPIVVLSPHNQCNCRCVMCDIWKIREPEAMLTADMERLLRSFVELGVRWVAFTGGEPQLNSSLYQFARMLRSQGIRVTLLTAGLLLEEQAEAVAGNIDDLIVSLDGPSAIHDRIRRVPHAFDRMKTGVRMVQQMRPGMDVRGRCTVQKMNHCALRATIGAAKEIGLRSISFLAADVTSTAFNHPENWSGEQRGHVVLESREVDELETEIEAVIRLNWTDLQSGYIVEGPDKMRRIVRHFRAYLGELEAVSPACNAPWHSAVIEANGNVRPCFFHPALGNIHDQSLPEILNSSHALQFRSGLKIPLNPVCRKCVCSLHYKPQESQVFRCAR